MLKHMRKLQKRLIPTPEHAEELAKIRQIFNELKPQLECGGARLRCLLDVEKKLREETAENNLPQASLWAGKFEKNYRMPGFSLWTRERTPALPYRKGGDGYGKAQTVRRRNGPQA